MESDEGDSNGRQDDIQRWISKLVARVERHSM
jgi:hypothetical protein